VAVLTEQAKRVTRHVRRRYRTSPLWFALHPRRFQAYGIGIAKSGTHSIAGLFETNYRADHEPENPLLVKTLLNASQRTIDLPWMTRLMRERDRRLWLEMDSSCINYFFLDILLDAFPDARYLLTIRDPYSWLDSFLNHQLARDAADYWTKFREVRFRPDRLRFAREEQILAERGLYTLDAYLSYWVAHNTSVLSLVPKERLLVVRTQEIVQDAPRIAAFLTIPADSLDTSRAHSFRAQAKYGLLNLMDRRFLEDKVQSHCRELMDQFFPEVRCLSDAVDLTRCAGT